MFEQVTATLDWLAAGLATRLGFGDRPHRLARPMVGVALLGGLAADAVGASLGGRTLGFVALTLTLCGTGALWLVVGRFSSGRGTGGGTRSLGQGVLEAWLRRLQLAFAAMLVVVLAFTLVASALGSVEAVLRNLPETVRLGGLVLAISYALGGDDPGVPAWLAERRTGDAWGSA